MRGLASDLAGQATGRLKLGRRPSLATDGRILRGDTPLKVNVRTRGQGKEYVNERRLEIHPLALAIPPMTIPEQKAMRKDIEDHGVKVPVVLYPDPSDLTTKGKPKHKVLDGRHRAYFASVTGQPIELTEFDGTEAEARAYVYSLNAMRRHLTVAQRTQLAIEMFEPEAKKEALRTKSSAISASNRTRSNVGQLANIGNGRKAPESVSKRIADRAGPGVSERSVQRMRAAGINASARSRVPETVAAIESGKITSAKGAADAAARELNRPGPKLDPMESVTEAAGAVRNKVANLLRVLELNGLPGQRGPRENIDILLEARTGIDNAITELQRRS
jgi:hypothetical protein